MSVNLAPGPFGVGGQFFSGNTPLNGGLIYTYAAGTTTPLATFTTNSLVTPVANANPIILNSQGILPQEVWLTGGLAYKFIVTDSLGNVIFPYTMDNISGINDFSSIPANQEWTPTGLTPTFASTTSFTLPGDQTGNFRANRRVKIVETAGTVYGTVTSSSVVSSITTVNVLLDSSAVVDSGISAVSYGILDSGNVSIPQYILAGLGITVAYANGIPTISSPVPRSLLAGFTLSTAGSSATMSIAAGQATDSTNVFVMSGAASSKTTAAWAVGSAVGGLDTGAIANNTTYHFFSIRRPDTGVVDYCFSLSPTTPTFGTIPAAYTQFRRIGSARTNGSAQWVGFVQDGDLFQLTTPVNDIAVAAPGNAAVTRTLTSIPTGVNFIALITIILSSNSAAADMVYVSDLATTDLAPSTSAAPFGQVYAAANLNAACEASIRTNTSAQIRSRMLTGSTNTMGISTLGWIDTRGRNA